MKNRPAAPDGFRGGSGAVLIIVLIAITVVSSLVLLTFSLVHQRLAEGEELDEFVVGAAAAKSVFATALALLAEPGEIYDSLDQAWAKETEGIASSAGVSTSTTIGRQRFLITDIGSRIDVNTAPERVLAALPSMSPGVLDALLDWRDEDDIQRPDGAERGYYESLPQPYEPANGTILTRGELSLIRGWDKLPQSTSSLVTTSGLFNVYSGDLNAFANILVQQGISRFRAQRVVEEVQRVREPGSKVPRATSLEEWGDMLSELSPPEWRAVRPYLTLDGTINVNTAPPAVLAVLLQGLGMPSALADSLVGAREGQPFAGEAQLAAFLGDQQYQVLRDYLTVRSRFFQIDVLGSGYGAASRVIRIRAIVERSWRSDNSSSNSPEFQLLSWREWRDVSSAQLSMD